jgi:hypothetical protein
MTQKISRIELNKDFSLNRLSKIGGVSFKGGVQKGAALKKTLVGLGAGKSKFGLETALKRQGVAGYQLNKRKEILSLAYGDNEKKIGLTEEQIERNLQNRMRREADTKDRLKRGELYTTHFAAGKVQTIGRTKEAMETTKGTAADLGISGGRQTGFAGQSGKRPIDNSAPKVPPTGARPVGM